MFNRTMIILLILTLCFTLISCNSNEIVTTEGKDKEIDEIRNTILDYIEGWYDGDVERMKRALHPDLVKRRIDGDGLHDIDYGGMIASTKRGGGEKVPKDSYEIEVKILDIHNNLATAMTQSQFIDYIHLAKIDGKWTIVNVLWGYK